MINLEAKTFMAPGFAKALNSVMGIKRLSGIDKFKLVKLRKQLVREVETLKDTTVGMKQEETMALINDVAVDFEFNPMSAKLVDDILTADELYWLEPLLEVQNG